MKKYEAMEVVKVNFDSREQIAAAACTAKIITTNGRYDIFGFGGTCWFEPAGDGYRDITTGDLMAADLIFTYDSDGDGIDEDHFVRYA